MIALRIRQAKADARGPLAARASPSNRLRSMRPLLGTLAVMVLALHVAPVAAAEEVRLDRVVISGNHRVEEEAIRVRLNAKPGSIFSEETVDADIRELYGMRFFDDIEAGLANVDGESVLTYHVTERPFIRDIRIDGADEIDDDEIEGMVRVRPNTILDPEKARRGIEEVKTAYEQKGYLDADVRYETTPVGENEATLTFFVDEGDLVRITEIVFEGNDVLDDGELKGILQTKEKAFHSYFTKFGNLDRDALKTDTERLTAYYYDHGYVEVRVGEPVIERYEEGLKVTFKIHEGSQYNFGEVGTSGEVLPEVEELELALEAESGEIFQPSELREDINQLTEAYGEHGYAFVNVTPETRINEEQKTVDIQYVIARGPEVRIDRIEITGNTKTRDKVVRRELALQEQQRFAGSKLRRSQDRLRRLGFFEDVNITTRKADADDRLDVLVDVKEASTGSFSAGAGISSANSFVFNIRVSDINLFGRGQRLVLNIDFGQIRRNATISFTEPHFLGTELTLGVDVFNWEFEFRDFTRGAIGGGVRTLYPLEAMGLKELRLPWVGHASLVDTRIGLEYRFEEAEISDVSFFAPAIIRQQLGKTLISSVTPRLFRDTRDHPVTPTTGSVQDFFFQYAGVGPGLNFIKAGSRARWYFPVWETPFGVLTYSTGWDFGFGQGLSGEQELPLFERYFPGGINSMRGFEVRSMGPRNTVFGQRKSTDSTCPLGPNRCASVIDEDPVGGSQKLIFTNEFVFPIIRALGLRGVIFFDAGNAFSAAQGIEFSDMRMSAGGGVRWLSPFGPLRIELGFALNAKETDETEVIQFSFGGR